MKAKASAKVSLDLKINTNEEVLVRLSESGKKIYASHFKAKRLDPPPLGDDNGWSVFLLWELMHIFGPELRMGKPVPFAGNVIRIKT